jgi:hypothetical protein
MYMTGIFHTFQAFLMYMARITVYTAHGAFPLLYLPLLFPLAPLSVPLSLTWNPPCCDRIRPPRSQVACKLTPLDPPSPQPSPFRIPRTPNTPRLNKTTSGTTRHLLSGTRIIQRLLSPMKHIFFVNLISNL